MAWLHLISSGKERGSVGMAADQWGWPDDDSRPGDEGLYGKTAGIAGHAAWAT